MSSDYVPPGRRSPRDPEDVPDIRRRMLAAAQALFAERGYDGVGVRDITVAAEASPGAITYHFGSKQHLYFQVLLRLVGPLRSVARRVANRPSSPLERIESLVREIFTHIRLYPEMPAIMVREMASGREIAPVIVTTMKEVLPLVAGIIVEGQRDGSIRAGDPVLLTLSTFAQPVYLNVARPMIAAATGLDLKDAESFDRVIEHCVTTVRAALAR